jgi:uncharacterized protein DUF4232
MNDVQDEITRMLHEKASDVAPHAEVPPSLARQVRPRIARNLVLVAASVAAVTFVAVTGLRSLQEPRDQSLDHGSSVPSGPQTCAQPSLEVSLMLEGAAGSREGPIGLRNSSGGTCTLEGTPLVDLLRPDGSSLDPDVVAGEPAWKVDASAEPPGWPLVTLEPGQTASVRFRWSNACDPTSTIRLTASDGSVVAEIPVEAVDAPPCNGPGKPTVEIGPFEPGA